MQPLLIIEQLTPPLPDLTPFAALAFTSGHGVTAFAALTPDRSPPAVCVGDVTAATARAAGFGPVYSAAGGIGDLARWLEAAELSGPVLSPGAVYRAGDLSGLVPDVRVETLAVYQAVPSRAGPPTDIDLILLHSPRAARQLAAVWPADRPLPTLVALSPAVARPFGGHGQIRVAAHPDEDSLMQALGKALARV